MKQLHKKFKSAPIQNGFTQALEGLDIKKVVPPCPRLKLMTSACVAKATRDFAPVAEALIGFHMETQKIVRFTDVIIPGSPGHSWCLHKDKGYPLFAKPLADNHWFHMAYCDSWKLGQDPNVVFGILRVFSRDARPKGGRVQVALIQPADTGEFFRTGTNTHPVFNADTAQGLFSIEPIRTKFGKFSSAWSDQILEGLTKFSGVSMINSYRSAEEQLENLKSSGIAPEGMEIEDHSNDDPSPFIEPLGATLEATLQEGHESEIPDAMIPSNPLLVTAGAEDEDEDETIPGL